ncbi:MAG TPA: proprotein convertase P-domain-containing protein [Kofleriaceae bacterium]|nr:proprotein convertase P-domain-containing protein [Kofleriaceae bacterium]
MRTLRLSAWAAICLAATVAAGCDGIKSTSDEGDDQDPGNTPGDSNGQDGATELPPSAVQQIEALIAEKESRTPEQRKIDSQLLYLKNGTFAASIAPATAKVTDGKLKSLTQVDPMGRALVDVKGAAELTSTIESLGGTVVDSSAAHSSIRAWVPLDKLETLAAEPSLTHIRSALTAETALAARPGAKARLAPHAERVVAAQQIKQKLSERAAPAAVVGADAVPVTTNAGAALSEGSTAMGAERARRFFNADGTGVKIGVLSDSDDFKEESIATGDLPADTLTIPGQDGRPGAGEGTAMMQIVHDVAPGAQLFFATAFLSPESFADNIRRLRFEFGCDIIVDDIIYFFESPFQDDIIAQAVADVIADGGMYFSSAGNEGNFDDGTTGTWEGDFKAGGELSTLPSGYTVHDFGGKVISNRIELDGGPVIMHWSDPGTLDNGQSSNDYDLFILDQDLRNVVIASTDVQDGDDDPFEFIGFVIPSNFRVVVAKHPEAEKRTIRVMNFRGELGIGTSGASFGHSQVANAFGVAAVDAFEAEGGEFVEGATTPTELFSSDGDRRVFYNADGSQITGSVTGTGGQLRKKPDVAGADGVSTTVPVPGLDTFFGTSAAAPHAAAIAGLLKSAAPTATAGQIRQALLNGALDIEAAGRDRDSGVGIVSAFNSLAGIGARPAAFIELGELTATPTTGDAILPGGSGEIEVSLANNGGATAGTVRATLSSPSPFVTVTSASASFPSLPPGSLGASTPFSFDVSPDAPCGEVLPFSLSVTFSGRGNSPTVFSFNVQSGRISDAVTTTTFAGAPVSVPDGDLAGVDIPLEVAGAGQIAKLVFRIGGETCDAVEGSTTVGVDHTWVGDLIFRLTSPSGTSVAVINQAGGPNNSGNNFCQTVIDDAGTTSINDVTPADAPFTGTFAPSSPTSAFTGESADGTWTLNVSDTFPADSGSVRAFSVDVAGFDCTP